ncbi:TIGR01619 family protein [Pasteurellaceae bacterium 22721_9_1]
MDLQRDINEAWKSYRTWLNEKPAIVSVNMRLIEKLMDKQPDEYVQIAYVYRNYEADEKGLPEDDCCSDVFSHLMKTIAQMQALPNVLYAGHVLSGGRSQIFLYFNDKADFLEALEQVEYDELVIQQDTNWDTYFEFLMPSPLEEKFSQTEETLSILSREGIDLSATHTIEHRFHFVEKEDIERFVEKCALSEVRFDTLKYTEDPVQIFDDIVEMENVYLVKVQQEMAFNSKEIFSVVEFFEQMAEEFSAQYLGWEFDYSAHKGKYLN